MGRRVSEFVLWEALVVGAEDVHGNAVESWAAPVSVGVFAYDPGSTSEPRDGGDRVIVDPVLYAPSSVVFGAHDRVSVRGELFTVEGVTRVWEHPEKVANKGNVVSLKRVVG